MKYAVSQIMCEDSPGLPLCFCILQMIKKWRCRRPGNKASDVKVNHKGSLVNVHLKVCTGSLILRLSTPQFLIACRIQKQRGKALLENLHTWGISCGQ